jgi:hypothetical protein
MCFSLELKKLLSTTLLDSSGTGSPDEEATDAVFESIRVAMRRPSILTGF